MTGLTRKPFQTYILPALAALCLLPFIDPALALVMGVACALFIGNPYARQTEKLPKTLLAWCVVGLGGGMNLLDVLQAGASGFVYTAISIALTLALGLGLMRALKVDPQSGVLISIGTAICGGSAIAAMAPVLAARSGAIAVSLAVVFVLNGVALVLFPMIGQMTDLTQHQFGLWSALAIHDTSSVVGAGLKYGEEALQTGTSVKLARALWIVPLVFAAHAFLAQNAPQEAGAAKPKPKYPWFILGFLALAALVTFVPALAPVGEWAAYAARRGLVLTLFLIGTNINADVIRSVGLRPFVLGVTLWVIVSCVSLAAILCGWIV